jgi:uncharacterized protein YcbX
VIRVEQMYVSPVKSLALAKIDRGYLDKPGIAGDRAFFLIDGDGDLLTQRECGKLVQVRASYDAGLDHLELRFPDGRGVAGVPEPREPVTTAFFAERPVEGQLVTGEWSEALSDFAGRDVRLVKADRAGSTFDGYPLSMCSTASVGALAQAAGEDAVDGRRFRQNIYLSGASAHEEDEWVGGEVRVGQALLRVKMRDSRCAVTTHSPETGEIDMNTLKIIASYRTDQPKEVNFGVYCTVAEPGEASVGDEVVPLIR